MSKIESFKDLIVYQKAYKLAMEIFEISKKFPKEEKYSLTDQIRRSSRSVTTCIAESWARRRYVKSFVSKLVDALGEENETEVWLDYSFDCKSFQSKPVSFRKSVVSYIQNKISSNHLIGIFKFNYINIQIMH